MKPNSSSDSSERFYRRLRLLSGVELAVICVWSLLTGADTFDSPTYFTAWETLLTGVPDHLRTPVYPVIVGALRAIAGSFGGLVCLYFLQSALFILSIGWMRELLEGLVNNRKIVRWATAVYAVYPGPLTLCGIVLTESLALTGTVGLLLLLFRAYTRRDWRPAAWSALVLVALVFLRPALLYLPVALLLFWIIVICLRKTDLRVGLVGLLAPVVSLGLLAAYCSAMKANYGIAGPSSVSGTNNYFTVRSAGLLPDADIPDPDIRATVDSLLGANGPSPSREVIWAEILALSDVATPAEMIALTSEALKANPGVTLRFIVMSRLPSVCGSNCVYGGSVCPPVRALTKTVSVNSGAAILMLLILMIVMLRKDLRQKHFSLFLWFLCGLFIVAYATVTVGAQNEWPRLLIPNYPVLLILASSLLTRAVDAAR